MDVEHMVSMANDIATFFQSDAGSDGAAAKTANHLRMYWDPRMRTAIIKHLGEGGEGLSPLARAAIGQLQMPAAVS